MWFLPGDDELENSSSTVNDDPSIAPSVHEVSALRDGNKAGLPTFNTDYPKDTILNVPVSDEEWPMKDPVVDLVYSYGCDAKRKDNLHVLSDTTVAYASGGMGVIYDLYANKQNFLQPSAGNAVRHLAVHPSRAFIAAAERGPVAGVNIFEYPALRLIARLPCDADKDILCIHFNREGSHLLTISPAPSYLLTIWDWENETALIRSKASTNYPIIRAKFSAFHTGVITTSGIDHIKFWEYQSTDHGWQIHCTTGKYGSRATSTIECFVVLALGSVITASSDGAVHKWVGGEIECEILRRDEEKLHEGTITNMLSHGRNLITLGTDGFIRLWSWDQLEGPSDSDGVFLDIVVELTLGHGNVPVSMVPFPGEQGVEHGEYCWLILDESGILWKANLPPDEHPSVPAEVMYAQSAAIRSIARCLTDNYFATAGEDGSICVYNNDRKVCLAHLPGNKTPATAISWIRRKVSGNGLQLIAAGFADGTVKTLQMTETWNIEAADIEFFLTKTAPLLTEVTNTHIQREEILNLNFNEDTEIIVSISSWTLLLLSLAGLEVVPIGLYKIESPTFTCWKWTAERCEMTLLITTGIGLVYEVNLPDVVQEDTLKVLKDPEVDSESYLKQITPLADLGPRVYEFKSIRSRLQSSTETEVPMNPSKIVWCMYDPIDTEKFWMSTADFDAGYLYCCDFSQEGPSEPLQAVRVDPFSDTIVDGVLFLDSGHLMVVSTMDGQIQIFLLKLHHVVESRTATWKVKVHEGAINGIFAAADLSTLVTVGADGNVLSYNLMVPNTSMVMLDRRFFRDILLSFQNTTLSDKEERDLEKFLRADQNLRLDAERKKDLMADELEKLKAQMRVVIAENQKLPPELQIQEAEFLLHQDVRAAIEGDFARRVATAKNYQIVERVKGRIILERLLEYFRGELETVPEVRVRSFDGKTEISTFWVQKVESNLEKNIVDLKAEIASAKASMDCAVHPYACRLRDDFYLESLTSFELTGTTATKNVTTTKKAWQRLKFAEHLERSKRRRQEWRALLNRRPNVSEENELFLTSENRRISGQEYTIKQNEEHAIHFMASYLSAPEVKLELLEMRKNIRAQKTEFNNRIVAMRDEKLTCITHLGALQSDLEKLHKKIPREKQSFLDDLPSLEAEESAHRSLRPSPEECSKTFEERQRAELRKHKRSAERLDQENLEVGEGNSGLGADGTKRRFARLQSFTTRQLRLSLQADAIQVPEETPWDDLVYELSEEERLEQEQNLSLLLYHQGKILESAKIAEIMFDGQLSLLRHDKFALDIELKRAELHVVMYQWEYKILNEYEDRETELSREEAKLRERQTAKERRLRMLDPEMSTLQTKLKLYRDREERIKAEFESQLRNVINQSRFHPLLTNIFNHNIKGRSVSTALNGDEGACIFRAEERTEQQPDCSVSSFDVASRPQSTVKLHFKRSLLPRPVITSSVRWAKRSRGSRLHSMKSTSSVLDFRPTEIYVCPKNLDRKTFQAVHTLNRQYQKVRRDIEDEMDRNRQVMEISSEAREELEFIKFFLSVVSGSLHKLRLEKFSRWKDIPFPVAVRMDQVQFVTDKVLRSDLFDGLVFDERNLEELAAFVMQLQDEIKGDSELLGKLAEDYTKLQREQVIFSKRIEDLKKDCQDLMVKKFGGIIDLDQADNVRCDPQLQELRDQLKANQKKRDEIMAEYQKEATNLKKQLTETRWKTTDHMKTICAQMADRDLLIQKTRKRVDKIGRGVLENVTTEDLRHHQEQFVMWEAMAETQEAETDALSTEIALFKRKDTDIHLLKQMIERRYEDVPARTIENVHTQTQTLV